MKRKELGEKIRYLRDRCGMSQSALAELIDVSFQMVQKYEKGASNISVERLSRIAEVFEIPVTEFFIGETTYDFSDGTAPAPLTAEEQELLNLFRRIRSDKLKADMLTHLKNIADLEAER